MRFPEDDGQNHAAWVLILNVCIKVLSLTYGHKHDGAKKLTMTDNEVESVGRMLRT